MNTTHPIEIRAGDLKPAIAGFGKVISTRATLPALQCVKVETPKRDTVRFTATDLSVRLVIDVHAHWKEKVDPFLIPLQRLRELTKQSRAGDILPLLQDAKAPLLDEHPETKSFRASPIELPDKAASGLVHALACSSQDPTRQVLRGAYFDTSGKGKNAHRIVGTDGRHLFSSNSLHLPEMKKPVILPDHKVWQWKLLAESRPWTLRLGAENDGKIPFRIDGPFWSVNGDTLEGNYPNYRQVVPPESDFKIRAVVSEPALDAIVRLIPRLPGKKQSNRPVGIHFEKGQLGLLARETNDEPWGLHPIDRFDAVKGKNPGISVFVNRDYLRKAAMFGLNEFNLIDAQSPLQLRRDGDLMIVMPVRALSPERIERPKMQPAVKQEAQRPDKVRSTNPAPRKRRHPGSTKITTPQDQPDPINEVESRIASATDALATVGKQLEEATGSLKTVRRHRGEDQEELRGFRSLFSTIRKITTRSN